jgi:hypothetical protein
MKTPRELLLARHQAADSKLDNIRHETMAQLSRQSAKTQNGRQNLASWCLGGLENLWAELILPSRRIWTGLATTWVLILATNFTLRELSQPANPELSKPQIVMSLPQQERLLAELTGPGEPATAEPPKPYVPRPSSRRAFEIVTT